MNIPLYENIYQYLIQEISTKKLKSGTRMPSENALAQKFKVSRITIKKAFDKLLEEGLIVRVQGKGTFLSEKSLAFRSKPRLIGYAFPKLNNMFMGNLLNAINDAVTHAGFQLVIAQTHDSQEAEVEAIYKFQALGVVGIIVYPIEGEIYNEIFLKLFVDKFPLVIIDRYLHGVETNCVYSDNVGAGFMATEHLLKLGHKKIGFVSHNPHGTTSVEDRLAGYIKALHKYNIFPEQSWQLLNLISMSNTNEKLIEEYLYTHSEISALVAVNSGIGRQILLTCYKLGLRVPQDISLILFDNQEQLTHTASYIKQQVHEIGEAAFEILARAIAKPNHGKIRKIFDTILVEGETTKKYTKRK